MFLSSERLTAIVRTSTPNSETSAFFASSRDAASLATSLKEHP